MNEMNFDARTKELEGTFDRMLWDLSVLDYRANELRLACEAIATGLPEDALAGDGENDRPALLQDTLSH